MPVKDRRSIASPDVSCDLQISPKAKGERLRRIRHMANLSREEFCADGETNITTLISWEIGRFGGLSAKGAAKVIARVAKEGVFCSPEWLLYEIGVGPEVRADYKKIQTSFEVDDDGENSIPENLIIIEELMLFRKLNKHAIDFVIDNDSMLPNYRMGDYVGGTKRFGAKILTLISWDCIVQLTDGRVMMRNLQRGPRDNSYNLIPTNLQTNVQNALIYDVELVAAAPVIWHRRKEP